MPTPVTLLDLPVEIHLLITDRLDFRSLIRMRMSCQYFKILIRPLSHTQLLKAECSEWAKQKDLYACRDCLRLLPRDDFADRMVEMERARLKPKAGKRFCLNCGIYPKKGTWRYSPGIYTDIKGVWCVFCIACREFGRFSQTRFMCEDCSERLKAIEKEERRVQPEGAKAEPPAQ